MSVTCQFEPFKYGFDLLPKKKSVVSNNHDERNDYEHDEQIQQIIMEVTELYGADHPIVVNMKIRAAVEKLERIEAIKLLN